MKHVRTMVPFFLCWPGLQAAAAPPEPLDFARDVRPILERSCWKCHGPEKQKGGLRFDRRPGAKAAGDSGKQAILPGRAEESELIRRVEAVQAEERMPPNSEPLGREQIKILRAWIDQGANWPENGAAPSDAQRELMVTREDRQHWSYRPLKALSLPAVHDASWCRTPVDRFILAAL